MKVAARILGLSVGLLSVGGVSCAWAGEPSSEARVAKVAMLRDLWKSGSAQSFFDRWVAAFADEEFALSSEAIAFEKSIAPGIDGWAADHLIQASPAQAELLARMDHARDPVHLAFFALTLVRGGEAAGPLLGALPPGHRFKFPLARTFAISLARKGETSAALDVLRGHAEAAVLASKEPEQVHSYHLLLARVLYQAGSYGEAERNYERIPARSREFLKAREELLWVHLRSGDTQKLRGGIAALAMPLFEGHFSPELFLVRAISSMKLCLYDQVARDLRDFSRINGPWAKRIDRALAEKPVPAHPAPDEATVRARARLVMRQEELARLPPSAVELRESLAIRIEEARRLVDSEHLRQWRNQRAILSEAIRKLRFVKVELVGEWTAARDRVALSQSSAQGASRAPELAALPEKDGAGPLRKSKDEIAFRHDGVVWVDELFRLRSLAQARCLGRGLDGGNEP